MSQPVRILLIEDLQDDAELILTHLRESNWDVQAILVSSRDELRQRLGQVWDLILCDYALPQFSAPEALAMVQMASLDTPFIVVSGSIGEEAAVDIMRQGACDCINKGNLGRLLPAIEREFKQAAHRRARRAAEQELQRLAYHDDHSGLPNRRYLLEQLRWHTEQQPTSPFALLYFAIDRIRMLSDTLGQGGGGRVEQEVAQRLYELLPDGTLLAQIGYDEFSALISADQVVEEWEVWIKALLHRFESQFLQGERRHFIAPTVGVYLSDGTTVDAEGALRKARAAMQRARSHGEAYGFFTRELERENLHRLLISHRLRGALQHNAFEIHYQPKVGLSDGKVCGLEALIRWHDEELGQVPPAQFIPIAEGSGEIIAIGEWVLHEVCRQQRHWRDQGLPPVKVAVNVSVHQLRDPGFVARLHAILEEAQLPPAALELEVTESGIMGDACLAAEILAEVQTMGITVAVDDFGTGYSSLSYLKKLPLSTLKIDRSFITDVLEDAGSRAIVEAIIALAHGLGLKVVAEGVETTEHLEFLSTVGCEECQGYLFSRPLNALQTESYLWQHSAEDSIPTLGTCLQFDTP